MVSTPFGKYGDIVATVVGLLVILAAVCVHLFRVDILATGDTAFIDEMAWVFVGLIAGTKSASNGYSKQVAAAHERLDAIGAPPAAVTP